MTTRRNLIVPASLLGIVFLIITAVYWVEPTGSLPTFFPGQEAGFSHHPARHGTAAPVVALACFVFAWFQSGPTKKAMA